MMETVPSGSILHGRYRIERVLGSGGFGHVYLAVDQATQQQYAIKEYLVTGPSGQEQLQHEATVLSHLHHPNLPAFLDAFIERGRYYVVLNYIEGNDLTDLIRITRQRNETIPYSRIMEWLLAICNAVTFLHSQQPAVIHRDIKPDNIRITSDGTAILVDLGNAKAAADGVRTLFFIRHQGTPGYAPPEQYPGGAGTDIRSDIYALGGTLYFMLTTHEPPSVSLRNQSIQQGQPDLPTLRDVLANNPPEDSPEANAARQFRLGVTKPSKPAPRHSRHVAQLGTLPPNLLNRLNSILQKSMAMRPKDRYQSVADFARELKGVMNALPAPVQPPAHRPVDPHSTQPDLPMLFESLQAAKEQEKAAQQQAEHSTAPIPPPSTPASIRFCPRCNTALAPRASYCPQCGATLPQNSAPAPGSAHAAPHSHSISQPHTAVATQQARPTMTTSGTTSAAPPPAAIPGSVSTSEQIDFPSRTAAPAITTPGGVNVQVNAPVSQRTSGFRLRSNIVIPLLILLAVLIVVALFVFILGHA